MYIVTELCNGWELFDMLADNSEEGLPEEDAKVIMKKLLLAINHCHSNGIAHWDVKPENIMIELGDSPEVKLIDFGLAY